jgi:hypothetical protein
LLGIIIIVLGSCEITDQNSRLLHLKNGHNWEYGGYAKI